MDQEKAFHLHISKSEIGEYVFLPGSVERVRKIAGFLDSPREIVQNREFLTYTGKLENVPVSITSTGIGGPSTAIAVEELHQLGAHTMIRIGSCASTSSKVRIGDVVIPNAAIRMEGTGLHYLPVEFPAVPNYQILKMLETAAKTLQFSYNIGITITKDSFYTEVSPQTKPIANELRGKWSAYKKGNATSTCMECAPLFLIGASLGIRVGAVLISATNDDDYSNDDEDYPRDWEDRAIKVGIEAMRQIIRLDQKVRIKNKGENK